MCTIIGNAEFVPRITENFLAPIRDDPQPKYFYLTPKIHKKNKFVCRFLQAQNSFILKPLRKVLSITLQRIVEKKSYLARDSKFVAG